MFTLDPTLQPDPSPPKPPMTVGTVKPPALDLAAEVKPSAPSSSAGAVAVGALVLAVIFWPRRR